MLTLGEEVARVDGGFGGFDGGDLGFRVAFAEKFGLGVVVFRVGFCGGLVQEFQIGGFDAWVVWTSTGLSMRGRGEGSGVCCGAAGGGRRFREGGGFGEQASCGAADTHCAERPQV